MQMNELCLLYFLTQRGLSRVVSGSVVAGGGMPELDPEAAEGAGGEATRRLLGDYQTPSRCAGPTPGLP